MMEDKFLNKKTSLAGISACFAEAGQLYYLYKAVILEHALYSPDAIVRYTRCRLRSCSDCAGECASVGMMNRCPVCGDLIPGGATTCGGGDAYTCGCGALLALCIEYENSVATGIFATGVVLDARSDDDII